MPFDFQDWFLGISAEGVTAVSFAGGLKGTFARERFPVEGRWPVGRSLGSTAFHPTTPGFLQGRSRHHLQLGSRWPRRQGRFHDHLLPLRPTRLHSRLT